MVLSGTSRGRRMKFLLLSLILSIAIITVAAFWPVTHRIDRKLPHLPENRRRPF
jgi:hypothetical protein